MISTTSMDRTKHFSWFSFPKNNHWIWSGKRIGEASHHSGDIRKINRKEMRRHLGYLIICTNVKIKQVLLIVKWLNVESLNRHSRMVISKYRTYFQKSVKIYLQKHLTRAYKSISSCSFSVSSISLNSYNFLFDSFWFFFF